MPLSSFAPLYGILQGAQDVQNLQNQQQLNQLRQFALQQAQQQQQVGPATWNAIMGGAGGLPQQGGGLPMPGGGVPQQPLLQPSPQQPQAPAPVGGGMPAPGFQLPQLPSLGPTPFGPPQGSNLAGGGMPGGGPSTLPGFDGTTYGVGGPLGPSFPQAGLGMPSPFSALPQQGTFPGFDGTTYGVGLPQADGGSLGLSQGGLAFGQPQDSYAPDPLTGQIVPQPPITTGYSQQQQPQAPAAVGDPGTPAGLFANTILPIESGGRMDPAMTGGEGEIGPAQIKPATFQQYAQSGESIYNLQDNLRVGQRIADDLWQKSGGDPAAVLVGYNAGEGAMRTFQRAGDDPRSVRLAPQYQEAVARQQGRRTYAELNGHINAVTSPQEKALGAMGTRNTLSQMPNPLAFAGRIDAPQLAQIIERTNPGVSANVKMAVFEKLYPMLSQVGQQQFNVAWQQWKEAERIREFEETKDIERTKAGQPKFTAPDNFEITTPDGQTRTVAAFPDERTGQLIDVTTRQPLDLRGAQIRRASTQERQPGAPELIQTPQGLMQWDPQKRAFVPSSLPPDSHKLGTADPAKLLPTIHTFAIPGEQGQPPQQISVRQDQQGNYYDLNHNPVAIPPNAKPLTGAQAGGAGGVTRSQAEWVATYVEKTGTWPTTSGRNLALTNLVEQVLAERGVDPTKVAQAMGTFGATKSSLTAATKLRDVVHSYEGTALRNLDTATKEMHRTAPTGFGPWLNNWILTGEMQMGDTKPPAAISAVLTVANEYAKVMSGATGAAAATEGARREAEERLSPYFSAGQWDEAVRIAKTDMGNRMRELDDNVDVITSRLGRGAPAQTPGQGRAGPAVEGIANMSRDELADLVNGPDADKLTKEQLGAIQLRLQQLPPEGQ
jgi:hypothetical protein